MNNISKSLVLELAQHAIDAVGGERLTAQAAGDGHFEPPLHVVAIGKAAAAMAAGVQRVLNKQIKRTLVITKRGHVAPWSRDLQRAEVIQAGHPIPTRESLAAGVRLLEWMNEAGTDARFLFLISGGASSLVEAPVQGIDLATLQRINQWLLASGLSIGQINRVRRKISRIKGGNLLHFLHGRQAKVWLLSDVAADNPEVIGSGLLYPGDDKPRQDVTFPDWLDDVLKTVPAPARVEETIPEHRVLANLAVACEAAAGQATAQGLQATLHDSGLDGDAEATGRALAAKLRSLPAGIHIWGGETTVQLPDEPGRGGRNQHLALAAALVLEGEEDVCFLALGTDGSDGPTEDAGALVDGGTIRRGELAGLDAVDRLRHADSGSFLEASGDLISTGPTGTNVRDLVIAWKGG
jgi:hydroxypyruvate reductase